MRSSAASVDGGIMSEHAKTLADWACEIASLIERAKEDGWEAGLWYGQDFVLYNPENHNECEVIW